MKVLLITLLAALCLVATAGAARGGPSSKPVRVFITVPVQPYVSTVTPTQADAAVRTWLGQPTDAPCIGSTDCSIEGWYRHELGEVFDYQVDTTAIDYYTGSQADTCGAHSPPWPLMVGTIEQQYGIDFDRERVIMLAMGAGGYAGHFAPNDKAGPRVILEHFGLVGDWGVMEQYNAEVSCIPDWDYPNRGFSHELSGMMGMFVGGGCYQDGQGCFVGDPLSTLEKSAINRWSARWLREP